MEVRGQRVREEPEEGQSVQRREMLHTSRVWGGIRPHIFDQSGLGEQRSDNEGKEIAVSRQDDDGDELGAQNQS